MFSTLRAKLFFFNFSLSTLIQDRLALRLSNTKTRSNSHYSLQGIPPHPSNAQPWQTVNSTTYYTFHTQASSWYEAQAACKKESPYSHLVSVGSSEEQQFIVNALKSSEGRQHLTRFSVIIVTNIKSTCFRVICPQIYVSVYRPINSQFKHFERIYLHFLVNQDTQH